MNPKQKERPIEFRSASFKVHKVDEAGMFSGIASKFNTLIPFYNEKILPGAFTKTLKENSGQVPIFYNHWSDFWMGWGQEAHEDKKGLQVEGKLMIDDIQKAREIWSLMKEAARIGKSVGLSIGFRTWKDFVETVKGEKIRMIAEVELAEYSPTPFPANPGAMVKDVRSLLTDIRHLPTDQRTLLVAAIDGTINPDELNGMLAATSARDASDSGAVLTGIEPGLVHSILTEARKLNQT